MAFADPQFNGIEWGVGRDVTPTIAYLVHYDPTSEDEADVEAAVIAESPPAYRGHVRSSIVLSELSESLIRAVVRYNSRQPQEDTSGFAEPEFAFEIASAQVKIMASLAVIASGAASGKTPPNNGNLIGVKPDGSIEGLEVPQMVYSFSETHHFAVVNQAYKVALARLVGRVNFNQAFRGFAPGEVLTTGVSGTKKGTDLWQVRFQWSVIPNASNLAIGTVTVPFKAGWDYLELFTAERIGSNKNIERELTGYKVHRVLFTGDYSQFGIGL